MNIIKKIFAALTAAASVGVFSAASIAVSAEEEPTTTDVTTTATEESIDTTTSETTTAASDTTSDTATTTTAPASYSAWLSVNGIEDDQAVKTTFAYNGTYTASYKLTSNAEITSLVLESDINSELAAGVKLKVTSISFGAEGEAPATINFNNTTDDAYVADELSKLYRVNIISPDETVNDLDVTSTIPSEVDKTIYVTFTVEGLTDPVTTTTSTTTTSYTPNNYNNGVVYSYKTPTSTVTKTADEGVIAVVLTASAAAALAACALTVRKKRK